MHRLSYSRLNVAISIVLLAIAVGGCGTHGSAAPASAATPVPHVRVVRSQVGSVHPTVEAPGVIAPYHNVLLTSTLSEPAVAVRVQEGDRVTRGEVLAVFSTRDLRARLSAAVHTASADESKSDQTLFDANLTHVQAGYSVNGARAALVTAQSTLRNDQHTLRRDRYLTAKGYLPRATYEAAQTAVATDEEKVRSDRASLRSAAAAERINGTSAAGALGAAVQTAREQAASARSQAALIRAQIALATIVSPIDGRVVNRNINVGEYPLGRAIFTVQQLVPAYAEIDVPAQSALRIAAGDRVTIHASNGDYRGHVVGVLGQATPGGTNFIVKALVPDRRDALLAGLPIHATIALPAVRGMKVPITAFAGDARTHVFVVRNGTVHEVRVKARAVGAHDAIVSGLPAGQSVIANGQNDLTGGEKVAIR